MKKKKFKCTCNFCKRNHKWSRFLNKYSSTFTTNEKLLLDKIYMDLNMTELNYEVDEAVLDGSWPSAIEMLGRAMVKAEDIKKRREAGEKV
jgi:hypothetical protein